MNGTIYVQVTRRIPLRPYEHEDIVIGLSQIPAGADQAFIDHMMNTAELAIDSIRKEIGRRAQIAKSELAFLPGAKFDESAFAGDTAKVEVKAEPVAETQEPEPKEAAIQEAHDEELHIPHEDEVVLGRDVFGVDMPDAPEGWDLLPITEADEAGRPGGQIIAIMAGLGNYKLQNRRHDVFSVLLAAYGSKRGAVKSTKDLTKAEAYLILHWINTATPASVDMLREAIKTQEGLAI